PGLGGAALPAPGELRGHEDRPPRLLRAHRDAPNIVPIAVLRDLVTRALTSPATAFGPVELTSMTDGDLWSALLNCEGSRCRRLLRRLDTAECRFSAYTSDEHVRSSPLPSNSAICRSLRRTERRPRTRRSTSWSARCRCISRSPSTILDPTRK